MDQLEMMGLRNQKIRETFEIVQAPMDDVHCQYFVMYTITESEGFSPERIFGVVDPQMLAHIASRYRQTGILLIPSYPPMYGGEWQYDAVQPYVVYFMKATDVLYKTSKWEVFTDV